MNTIIYLIIFKSVDDDTVAVVATLRLVKLTTLETRRLRGDLIEVFKIFKGFDDLDPNIFFELSQAHTRGRSSKLIKPIDVV